MTSPLVVCLGIAVLDRIYAVEAIPREPVKTVATGHREGGGGMAATAAVAVAALGGRAAFWGRLGRDAAGDTLLAALRRAGVDTGGVRQIPGGRTATAAILVDPAGERLIAAFPGDGLADAETGFLPLGRLGEAGAALADCRWPEGALALLAASRRQGLPSVLDADIAAPDRLRPLLAACDHAVFSARGLAAYAPGLPALEALAAAAAASEGFVAVTEGAGGASWIEGGRLRRLPGHPVAVRDTTGAGDTFHGAFALALAEGGTPPEAMAFANAAAALKCRNGAGWDGMPDRAAVDTMLQEGPDAAVAG